MKDDVVKVYFKCKHCGRRVKVKMASKKRTRSPSSTVKRPRRSPVKRTAAAKRAAATAVKRTAVKRTAVKRTPVKRTVKRTAVKRTAVKRTAVKRTAVKRTPVKGKRSTNDKRWKRGNALIQAYIGK